MGRSGRTISRLWRRARRRYRLLRRVMVWLTGDFKGSLRLHGLSADIDTRLIVTDF